jgi:hypothetical protein
MRNINIEKGILNWGRNINIEKRIIELRTEILTLKSEIIKRETIYKQLKGEY